MNKYRKAYNFIDGYVLFHSMVLDNERFKELVKALSILNELAEKATPRKPIMGKSQNVRYIIKIYECPNCHKIIIGTFSDYCYRCGQALSWGEEDE